MRTDRTFTMLKPDSVEKGNIGPILEKITAAGFRIVAMKLTQMTANNCDRLNIRCWKRYRNRVLSPRILLPRNTAKSRHLD